MSTIRPSNPKLLAALDVEYSQFHCCGDEDLVFLRCPACGHIMVFCYECDTLFPDLADTALRHGLALTSESVRVVCPACGERFEDHCFLRPENVDRYLPTAEQVREAGFAHLLSLTGDGPGHVRCRERLTNGVASTEMPAPLTPAPRSAVLNHVTWVFGGESRRYVEIRCWTPALRLMLRRAGARRPLLHFGTWRWHYSDDVELASMLARLRDAGFAFAGAAGGWPPAAVFAELRERGLLVGSFVELLWSGPRRPVVRES